MNLRFFISYPSSVPPISYHIPVSWSISYTIKNAGVSFHTSPSWATGLKWFIFLIFLSQILNLRFFISYPSSVPPISYHIPVIGSISYTIKNAGVSFHTSPSWATGLKWFIFLIFLSQILNLRFFISYPSSVPPISYHIPVTWSISYTIKNAGVSFLTSPSWATGLKWFIFLIFLSQILNLRFFISYPSSVPPISYHIPVIGSISYTIKNAGVSFHTSPSWATGLKWFIFLIFLSQILNLRFFISYPSSVPPISYHIPVTWSISYTIKKCRSIIPHIPILGNRFKVIYFLNIFKSNFES